MTMSTVHPLPSTRTQTPAPSPTRPTLRVAPEPQGRPPRQVSLLVTIGLVAVAMVLGLIGTYWQHSLVTDQDATIAALQTQVAGLTGQVQAMEGELATAQQAVVTQDRQIESLRAVNEELRLRYQVLLGDEQAAQGAAAQTQAELQAANEQLAATQAELQTTQDELAAANATIQTMVGAPLADGTHVGYLMAVGSMQSPPRLVIDRAKMVDGALVNEGSAWRTVEVAPDASVSVLSLDPYHVQPITLDRLAHLFVNPAPWAVRVAYAPFRITVQGGIVTAIDEIRPTG